jgi:hypothetical protein
MQSGSVGSIVQLLTTPERAACLNNKIPFINVCRKPPRSWKRNA